MYTYIYSADGNEVFSDRYIWCVNDVFFFFRGWSSVKSPAQFLHEPLRVTVWHPAEPPSEGRSALQRLGSLGINATFWDPNRKEPPESHIFTNCQQQRVLLKSTEDWQPEVPTEKQGFKNSIKLLSIHVYTSERYQQGSTVLRFFFFKYQNLHDQAIVSPIFP